MEQGKPPPSKRLKEARKQFHKSLEKMRLCMLTQDRPSKFHKHIQNIKLSVEFTPIEEQVIHSEKPVKRIQIRPKHIKPLILRPDQTPIASDALIDPYSDIMWGTTSSSGRTHPRIQSSHVQDLVLPDNHFEFDAVLLEYASDN